MSNDDPVAHFRVDLPRRALFTVQDIAGVSIACRSGCVWLTLDDDPRDLVLEAGEQFEGDIHRRVLVSAFEDSNIEVRHALPAALPAPVFSRPDAKHRRRAQPQADGLTPACT
ncbi:DUF2917 domain-containing protein [Variovorax dokdonensis]|uniref:DUF2917 domain-containing protein n=1 Tax=Variovorax dokdonensis TaxID=344883 RepID=A0ABT7NAB3_9BURK|nr:DUF2917 domain-containing protein [Variovorax dokdonensis]MDM0044873.1 DUF2917 domain-containing protein [Variovorax dokdonensis]